MLKLKSIWLSNPSPDNIMLWAAASLCFFGFLRAVEITIPSDQGFDPGAHLTISDVIVNSFKSLKMLKVRIKKTDPFQEGIDIFIITNSVQSLLFWHSYLVKWPPGTGPLFKFTDGRALTRALFVEKVHHALSLAGINADNYAGHSFHSGEATTAAKQGVGDAMIKMLGHWKNDAYQLYVYQNTKAPTCSDITSLSSGYMI